MGNTPSNATSDRPRDGQSYLLTAGYFEEGEQENWTDCSDIELEEQNGILLCKSVSSNDDPELIDKDSFSIYKKNVPDECTKNCDGTSSCKTVHMSHLSVTTKGTEICDKEKVEKVAQNDVIPSTLNVPTSSSSYRQTEYMNNEIEICDKVVSCVTNPSMISNKMEVEKKEDIPASVDLPPLEKPSSNCKQPQHVNNEIEICDREEALCCFTDSSAIDSTKAVIKKEEIPIISDLPSFVRTLETSSGNNRLTQHVNNVESVDTVSKKTDAYGADDNKMGSSAEKGKGIPGSGVIASDSEGNERPCEENTTNIVKNDGQKQHQNTKLCRILDPDAAAILYINRTRVIEEAISDFIIAYASYREQNCISIKYINLLLQRTENLTLEIIPPNIYCWIASQKENFKIENILHTFPEKFTIKDSYFIIHELYSKTEALAQLNFLLEEGTFYFFLNKFKHFKWYSIHYCFTAEPVATAVKILTGNDSVKEAMKMYFKNYHNNFVYDEKKYTLYLKRDYFEECNPSPSLSNHIITGYTGKVTAVNYISHFGNISFSWKNHSRVAMFMLGSYFCWIDQVPTDSEEVVWVGMIVYFDAQKCEKNSDVWHASLVWQGHRPLIKHPKTVCWCGNSLSSLKKQSFQNNPADNSTIGTSSGNPRQDRLLGQRGKIIEICSPYTAVAELLVGKQKETVFILSCIGNSIYSGTQLLPNKTNLRNYIKEGDEVKFNAVCMTKDIGAIDCDWFAKEVFIKDRKEKETSPSGEQSKSRNVMTVTNIAGVVTSLIGVTRGIVEFFQDGRIQKALFHRSQLCKDGGKVKCDFTVTSLLNEGDAVVLSAKAYPDMSDQWKWCATEVWLDKSYLFSPGTRESSEKESILLREKHEIMISSECPSNALYTKPSILQSGKNEETVDLIHECHESAERAEKEDKKILVHREQTANENVKSIVNTKLDISEVHENAVMLEYQAHVAGTVVKEKSESNEHVDSSTNSNGLSINPDISHSLENAVTANTSQYQHYVTPTSVAGWVRDELVVKPEPAVSLNTNTELKNISCVISELQPPHIAIARLKIHDTVEQILIFVKYFLVNDMPISFNKNLSDYLKVGDTLLVNAIPVTEQGPFASAVNWEATTARLWNRTEDSMICNNQEETGSTDLGKNTDSVGYSENKYEEKPPIKQQILSTKTGIYACDKETIICSNEIQPKMSHHVKSADIVRPEDIKEKMFMRKQDALNEKETLHVNEENKMKIDEKRLQMGHIENQDTVNYSRNKEIVTVLPQEEVKNKICTEIYGEIKELRPPFVAVATGVVNGQVVDIFIFISKINIGSEKLKCGNNVLQFMKIGDRVFMKVKENEGKRNFKWVAEEAWLQVEPNSCPDNESKYFTNSNKICESYMQEKAVSDEPRRAYSTEDLFVDDASAVSILSETNSLASDILFEDGSVKKMQNKNIMSNCNGRIIRVDATKGLALFSYQGNTGKAFFFKNKLYLHGKKWNKSMAESLSVGDIVHMDVRELTRSHFSCQYQADIVWIGKKPQNCSTQKLHSIRNKMERNPMPLQKQSTSQMTSQEVQKSKQDFTPGTLNEEEKTMQLGCIYRVLDDSITLWNTQKSSVIVSRNCCFLFGISLKDVSLKDIFMEGDVLQFILKDLPDRQIPVASAWFGGSKVDDRVEPHEIYLRLINFIRERRIDDTVEEVLVQGLCKYAGTTVASLQEKADQQQQWDSRSSSHEESKVTESSQIVRSDMPVEDEAENNVNPDSTETLPWVVLHPKMYHIMETSMTDVLTEFGTVKAAKFLTQMMKEHMKIGMEEMFIKTVLEKFITSVFEKYGNSTAADTLTTRVKDRVTKRVQEWMKNEVSDSGTGEKFIQNKTCHTVDRECNTEISGTVDGLKAGGKSSEEVETNETEKMNEGDSLSAGNKEKYAINRQVERADTVERGSQTISTGSITMMTIITDL